MKSNENEQNDKNLVFPTRENPGIEEEHTPILKEIRQLNEKEELDLTNDQESRKKIHKLVPLGRIPNQRQ